MKKIWFCLLLLVLITVSGSGCWSKLEIEQMAFVSIIGVDQDGAGKLLVSYQVVIPRRVIGGGGGAGPPVDVISVKARDLSEAVSRFSEISPRRVRFKQLRVIIFGEGLARQGLGPHLDFFARYWEYRHCLCVLVAKGSAYDLLVEGLPSLEQLPATGISFILERRPTETATRTPVVLGQLLAALSAEGREPLVSTIELSPTREASTTGGFGDQRGAVAEGRAAEEKREFAFRGAAVFRDDRLIGFLGPTEARGALWLQGKVEGGILSVPKGSPKPWASLRVDRARSKIIPKVENGKISFLVEIEEEGRVLSVLEEDLPVGEVRVLRMLEEEKEKAIRQEALAAWEKAKEMRSDFLGFGECLYRNKPEVWRQVKDDWNDYWLNKISVEVKVNCKLRRTGAVADPVKVQ
jgi:spore germination protein KC